MAEPGDIVNRCAAIDVVRSTACSLATTPDRALWGLGTSVVGV